MSPLNFTLLNKRRPKAESECLPHGALALWIPAVPAVQCKYKFGSLVPTMTVENKGTLDRGTGQWGAAERTEIQSRASRSASVISRLFGLGLCSQKSAIGALEETASRLCFSSAWMPVHARRCLAVYLSKVHSTSSSSHLLTWVLYVTTLPPCSQTLGRC
ncbi:hypothetical protein VTK56DRAFT_168 [Thermocarpiscus australiensis]